MLHSTLAQTFYPLKQMHRVLSIFRNSHEDFIHSNSALLWLHFASNAEPLLSEHTHNECWTVDSFVHCCYVTKFALRGQHHKVSLSFLYAFSLCFFFHTDSDYHIPDIDTLNHDLINLPDNIRLYLVRPTVLKCQRSLTDVVNSIVSVLTSPWQTAICGFYNLLRVTCICEYECHFQ